VAEQLPGCQHGWKVVEGCWAPSEKGQQRGVHVLWGGLLKFTVQPQPWDPLCLSPTNFLPGTAQNRVKHTTIKTQDDGVRSFNGSDYLYIFSSSILFINLLNFPYSVFFFP